MIDLLVMLVALVCAPAMVYEMWAAPRRRRGEDVPQFGHIARGAWAAVAPAVELLGYALKRAIAHQWKPTEDEKPRILRAVLVPAYDYPDAAPEADEQTDMQTDVGVFPLRDAIASKQLDRTRAALVEELVAGGWGAGLVRSLLKGDTGAIGAEVEAAKQRLGIVEAPRVVTVTERVGGQPQTREVAL